MLSRFHSEFTILPFFCHKKLLENSMLITCAEVWLEKSGVDSETAFRSRYGFRADLQLTLR